MATTEQCEKRLRQILLTRDDVIRFTADLDIGCLHGDFTDQEFLDVNIRHIFDTVQRRHGLDWLAVRIQLPTDAEQARLHDVAERRHSSRKIVISIVVAIITLLSLLTSWWVLRDDRHEPTDGKATTRRWT